MTENTIMYKARKSSMVAGLFVFILVFLGFILPLLIEGGPIEARKVVGIIILGSVGIVLMIAPLGSRLEIGEDYVRTYFFGFTTTPKIYRSNIRVLEYGNIIHFGGLNYGKGLKGWEMVNGKRKYFSIGENIYGKEAISHARRVLEQKS